MTVQLGVVTTDGDAVSDTAVTVLDLDIPAVIRDTTACRSQHGDNVVTADPVRVTIIVSGE